MKLKPMSRSLRTTLIYAVFGSMWILLSDSILEIIVPSTPPTYSLLQTIKGWLFVFVSALLLYVILVQDARNLEKHEEGMRESQALYRQLFEHNPQPMWVYDLETLRFLMVNDAAIEHYGYTREEFLSMTLKDIRPVEEIPALLKNLAQSPQTMEKSSGWLHHKKDGTLINVETSSHSLSFEGRIARMVLVNDITERKQAEVRIQTQLMRLSGLTSIDRAISSSVDMHLSLDVLLGEVIAQLNADAASILLLNNINQKLEHVAGKGFRSSAINQSHAQLGVGLAGQVGWERKVIHIPDLPALGDSFKRKEVLKEEEFLEYFGVPLIAKGQLKGVLEIFNRTLLTPDPEWLSYLETLGGQAAIAIENAQLFEGLQQSNQEMVAAYDATIAGWSHAMDLRDKETEGHTQRVTETTIRLANRMKINQQELIHLRRGALLHDIGKLGVPDHILLKPGKLTDEEWVIMRRHPTYAYEMLLPIYYLKPALDIPYCHHEKWDGTGYPRGLKGEQIPLAARIFAVVDVWDALRSDRPYRESWSAQKTRDYIQAESGKHFEPRIVEAFLKLLDEDLKLQ